MIPDPDIDRLIIGMVEQKVHELNQAIAEARLNGINPLVGSPHHRHAQIWEYRDERLSGQLKGEAGKTLMVFAKEARRWLARREAQGSAAVALTPYTHEPT